MGSDPFVESLKVHFAHAEEEKTGNRSGFSLILPLSELDLRITYKNGLLNPPTPLCQGGLKNWARPEGERFSFDGPVFSVFTSAVFSFSFSLEDVASTFDLFTNSSIESSGGSSHEGSLTFLLLLPVLLLVLLLLLLLLLLVTYMERLVLVLVLVLLLLLPLLLLLITYMERW